MTLLLPTILGALWMAWFGLSLEQCGRGSQRSPADGDAFCPRPIGEEAGDDPQKWTPWTHKPYCANSSLCVYTDATAVGNRGISIVASPEAAAGSLNILEHALGAPFLDPSRLCNLQSPPYEVRELPGRGKGLVATQHIPKDKVIMIDYASIVAPVKSDSSTSENQMYQLLYRAAEQLADPEIVYSLARKGTAVASAVLDVLLTNSFMTNIDEDSYMGLFPNLSVCDRNSWTATVTG